MSVSKHFLESMPPVLSNNTDHSKWNFTLKSPSLSGSSRFPLCSALVKIRTYLSRGNGGTRGWGPGDWRFPALTLASRSWDSSGLFTKRKPYTYPLSFCSQSCNLGAIFSISLTGFPSTTLARTCNKNRMERTRLFAFQPVASRAGVDSLPWATDHTCSNGRPNFISAYVASVATQMPLQETGPISPKSPNNITLE